MKRFNAVWCSPKASSSGLERRKLFLLQRNYKNHQTSGRWRWCRGWNIIHRAQGIFIVKAHIVFMIPSCMLFIARKAFPLLWWEGNNKKQFLLWKRPLYDFPVSFIRFFSSFIKRYIVCLLDSLLYCKTLAFAVYAFYIFPSYVKLFSTSLQ